MQRGLPLRLEGGVGAGRLVQDKLAAESEAGLSVHNGHNARRAAASPPNARNGHGTTTLGVPSAAVPRTGPDICLRHRRVRPDHPRPARSSGS
ncbi:protein of unassigned function [Methylobacterium oryzae CBMB20]|uniref:Protein of unassigned function n=1 Tax=Methylobacterium oryzae CBMB20 TaxID=693986 RepID=A0A089NQT4_9HYPH|nr:protein of unassigned function [Methylobacterium oryzae CBMB20]